jgi:hypothetical protein
MIEIGTVEWLVGGIFGGGLAVWGIAWGSFRYVDGKIAAVRGEAVAGIAEVRAETGREIDALRGECAKREDIQRIEAGLAAITGRIDQVLTMMAKRAA